MKVVVASLTWLVASISLWIKKDLQAYTYYTITLLVMSLALRTRIFEKANCVIVVLR